MGRVENEFLARATDSDFVLFFSVPEEHVASINGVQDALQQIMNMASPLLAVILNKPEDFPTLVRVLRFGKGFVDFLLTTSFAPFF